MAQPYAMVIESSEADRAVLLGQSHRRETAQALALRARIVLACADSTATHAFIAEAMGLSLMMGVEVSPLLCSTWPVQPAMYAAQERFERSWTSRSRPSSPRRWRPCQKTPPAGPPVQLAAHLGLSQTTVSRIWHALALAPHRTEGVKLSIDPYFVDKVRDIAGLHPHPPERALAPCLNEKRSIQTHSDTARPTSLLPSMSRPAWSSPRSTGVTASRSSFTSCRPSNVPRPWRSNCISCWITPAPSGAQT